MWKRMFTLSIFSMAALVLTTGDALSQPGRGKGGGGRSAGHAARVRRRSPMQDRQ